MASNVELLPLPKHSGKATDMFGRKTKLYNGIQMQDHAFACVEANTEYYRDMLCQSQDDVMKLSAENEALRAEVDRLQELCNGLHRSLTDSQAGFVHHRDRAERLAEELRIAEAALSDIGDSVLELGEGFDALLNR